MTEALRPARPSDAPAIARIYVAGWQDAYPGLLPDRLLVGMRRTDGRAERWARTIRHPARGEKITVAEAGDGTVIGFAGGGPARARGFAYDAEIYTLYVDGDHQDGGVGRRLFSALALDLAAALGPSLIVWVLAGNPARYFYEALGGRHVGRRAGSFGGAAIEELAFGWPDAAVLAASQG
ncbi:MAG: GNAT family N-acetyltransferase [Defluviicoccus sp.]|nr:GNAT family N-acetyltransferase [Defluviicoccus sp.]MDE0275381.1 GNAT family N-acetyltransferase [Defluviicoccus sp.]